MAQPATNAKIEELRFKLKTDPRSRLFYQLAEELRKAGQLNDAEQYLRSGLSVYPTYLAAWVSLGRVLRDQKNEGAAVEALNTALQLDPGNVVAARLLGDAYLALGQKVEAIKKYKLVLALLPSDEELRGVVDRIDQELHPPAVATVAPQEEDAFAASPAPPAGTAVPPPAASIVAETEEEPLPPPLEESPFDQTLPPFEEAEQSPQQEPRREIATADVEPMGLAHEESPFEEPVSSFTAASLDIEAPPGFSIEAAPLAAEVPAPVAEDLPVVDSTPVFETPGAVPEAADAANTLTMADLYVRQGAIEDARHIYENILARDPGNVEVQAKLAGIAPQVNPKVARLEKWLARVSRKEAGHV